MADFCLTISSSSLGGGLTPVEIKICVLTCHLVLLNARCKSRLNVDQLLSELVYICDRSIKVLRLFLEPDQNFFILCSDLPLI